MKILVPLKRVADPDNANKIKIPAGGAKIDTTGLEWKPNPFDEYALEAALRSVGTVDAAFDGELALCAAVVERVEALWRVAEGP